MLLTPSWFPLVQRARPPGAPLEARVRELVELAAHPGAGEQGLVQAAEVCNKAALIASDCGMPGLARELCWRQYDVLDRAQPLPASAAQLFLQPVLNIPRQLIRQGGRERSRRRRLKGSGAQPASILVLGGDVVVPRVDPERLQRIEPSVPLRFG
ncbi:hypothetical protein Misp01_67300 [Microtetraspora sp. NBRC 13810]|nr:hypothetical protein Misp01_67300 [Microtetraspora sp. NBRC 13810]